MTTSTRSITLSTAQARAVLVGLGTTDQDHRTHAVGVMADALLAPVEPDGEACGCGPDARCTYAAGLTAERNEAWERNRVQGNDLAALRDRAGREAEHERRRDAIVAAAVDMNDWWTRQEMASSARHRALRDAVEALREYTPAEVAAPADDEPAPPVGPSARDELHDLAPLPWSHNDGGQVEDRSGRRLLDVSGMDTVAGDERVAELLVRLVNGPDVTPLDAATVARHRAERAVLDAAREYAANRGGKLHVRNIGPLLDAAAALDAAPSTGGAS